MSDDDALHARALVERFGKPETLLCPQIRPAEVDWRYPIGGYCVGACPGRLMIPSIEEYRTNCTTPRFRECRWFQSAAVAAADNRQAA